MTISQSQRRPLLLYYPVIYILYLDKNDRLLRMLRVFRLIRALRPLRVINRAPGLKLVVQVSSDWSDMCQY